MKRTLTALLLSALALLGTAACGDSNGGSGESVTPDTESQVPAPVPT